MGQQLLEKETSGIRQNTYIQYIDVLRVLSMLSVVFLHTAAGSLRVNLGSHLWHFSNVFTAIMSTSVPIFFMLSGAMLLSNSKTASIAYTYKKRLPKALVPFIIWSLVAVAYYGIIGINSDGNISDALHRLKNIVNTPTTVHLWFMYALIPLYLLSPILKKLVDCMSMKLVKYCLFLWFTFSSLLPTLSSLVPSTIRPFFVINKEYSMNFLNGYIGYFLLGYYLLNYKNKMSIKMLSCIVVFDTAIISVGSWYKTMATGEYSEIFKVYSRAFVLILSISIFLLVKELLSKYPLKQLPINIVKFLSSLSFGVYLMHNLLIDALARVTTLIPVYSISRFLLSYAIVLIISFVCMVVVTSIKPTCYAFTGLTYKSACKSCNIQYIFSLFRRGKSKA
ncbi:MAG: acyltransferase [Ruminiclostridium sp.]